MLVFESNTKRVGIVKNRARSAVAVRLKSICEKPAGVLGKRCANARFAYDGRDAYMPFETPLTGLSRQAPPEIRYIDGFKIWRALKGGFFNNIARAEGCVFSGRGCCVEQRNTSVCVGKMAASLRNCKRKWVQHHFGYPQTLHKTYNTVYIDKFLQK